MAIKIFEKGNTCTKCLKQIQDGSVFCMHCGAQSTYFLERGFMQHLVTNELVYLKRILREIESKLRKVNILKQLHHEVTGDKRFTLAGFVMFKELNFNDVTIGFTVYDRWGSTAKLFLDDNHSLCIPRDERTKKGSDYRSIPVSIDDVSMKEEYRLERNDSYQLTIEEIEEANVTLDEFFIWVQSLDKKYQTQVEKKE